MKKPALRKPRAPRHDFNGFDDLLAKFLLGTASVLTALLGLGVFLTSFVGQEYLGFLKLITWLLGAFAVVGAVCGLAAGMRWRMRSAARRASARF